MQSSRLPAIKLAIALAFVSFLFGSFLTTNAKIEPGAGQAMTMNPLAPTQANLALGLNHFDAHCAICHGANGKGETIRGKEVDATDITLPKTQGKTDAELFKIISHGLPGTAMPAFGRTHTPTDIWRVVLFVRKLPGLTAEERRQLEAAVPPEAKH